MKITPLQCDINKKKYNFVDIVNNNINNYCSCGSVVEHFVSSGSKVVGSIPREHMC